MKISSIVLLVWLIIGAIAAGQRDYFTEPPGDCSQAGTLLVTIVAGPLNYVGVDPKISCDAPEPSE
ncbi:MAG TPA: hypothetical protein VE465_11395 [Streptosporangiaceae bacterium]|jgi:hypothetical protein|nr:hypothetical protein [Streptosporangiaceae bacterium]